MVTALTQIKDSLRALVYLERRTVRNRRGNPARKTRHEEMGETYRARLRASIRRFPLFGALDDTQLDMLSEGARFVVATRGDILCDSL